MYIRTDKNKERLKRHRRVRATLNGTADRPRLSVYRSLNHIYAQIIDDAKGATLVSASTVEKGAGLKGKSKKEIARLVGKRAAEKAIKKGIKTVVFDRGGYLYAGRVKELADGAREAGLKF